MNIIDLLQKVKNINDYINVTHEISDPSKDFQLHLNQNTVHTINQLKTFEIEYLSKSYGNGAATIVFKQLLKIPAGRPWAVAGRQLVIVLRYWLDAVRKHLIHHTTYWWSFLQLILKFINQILYKYEPSDTRGQKIGDILVELTAECLFDLVTSDKTDLNQKYRILHCLNRFCAKSNQEVRYARHEEFNRLYFVRVGGLVCSSGYAPVQQGALEALVRWLVERASDRARAAAARLWFPETRCPPRVRDVFAGNTWSMTFFEDSRKFLNTLNELNGQVTSVVCKKLYFGEEMFITGTERYRIWLDLNTADKSVTILLPARMLRSDATETLLIHAHNTARAQLMRASEEIKLVVHTLQPCPLLSSNKTLSDSRLVTLLVAPTDLLKFDQALRSVFQDKYQVYLDLKKTVPLPLTPGMPREARMMHSDDDTRFSMPAETKPHTFGPAVPKKQSGLATPSSVSSSSLAQLHEKLEALSGTNPFGKDNPVVSVRPQLSAVTEISDLEEKSFHSMSTLKLGQPRLYKNLYLKNANTESDQSTLNKDNIGTQSTESNDSVINDTNQSNEPLDTTTVNQLVQEALQSVDPNTKVIDNTPHTTEPKPPVKLTLTKKCTVLSATEESNSVEEFNDSLFSNSRKGKFGKMLRKQYASKDTKKEKLKTTDVNTKMPIVLVEKIGLNSKDDVCKKQDIIEPSQIIYDENDVIECLNSLITKVCDEMGKCFKYFDQDTDEINKDETIVQDKVSPVKKQKDKKIIKLKFKPNIAKTKKNKKDKKATEKVVSENSNDDTIEQIVTRGRKKQAKSKTVNKPINAVKDQVGVIEEVTTSASSVAKSIPTNAKSVKRTETALVRRKRKLYSPDRNELEEINSPNSKEPIVNSEDSETPLIKRKKKLYSPNHDINENIEINNEEDEEVPLKKYKTAKKSKAAGSIYSVLELERKNRPKRTLTKKRAKLEEPSSPRTLKLNAAFESAKTLESNENIIFADSNKANVYNFTSDSDSSNDFVQNRKLEMGSGSKTNGKKYGKTSKDENEKPKRGRKTPQRKTRSKTSLKFGPLRDLTDEKMREAKPVDTTISVEDTPKITKPVHLEPKLNNPPQMEFIDEGNTKGRNKRTIKKKTVTGSLVRDDVQVDVEDKETNKTLSPLPTLVIEPVSKKMPDDDTLNISNLNNLLNIDNDNIASNISNNTLNMLMDVENDIDVHEEISFEHNKKENSQRKAKSKINRHSQKEQVNIEKNKNARTSKTDENNINKNSDKSMITDGIAHGEMDKDPPTTEVLDKTMFPPRELEDLEDSSLKDYYVELTQEINKDLRENSAKQITAMENSSPVVCLQRLSPEYLTRYLPSNRSSESDHSEQSSNHSVRSQVSRQSFRGFCPMIPSPAKSRSSRNETKLKESQQSKKPANVLKYVYGTRLKSKIVKKDSVQRGQKSRDSRMESGCESNRETSQTEDKNTDLDKSPAKVISPAKSLVNSPGIADKSIRRRSNASNLEHCIATSALRAVGNAEEIEHSVKGTFNATTVLRTIIDREDETEQSVQGTFNATLVYETKGQRGKGLSNSETYNAKKGLVNVESASSSRVTEWLRRINEPSTSAVNDPRVLVKDTLQVMEKFDTILSESHQNTSKKLGTLFEEVQKQFKALDEEQTRRREEFIAQLQQFKSEFIPTQNKSREEIAELMKNLKQRGFQALEED